MLKAALLDFDDTLVCQDILCYITDIVGKKAESEQIDQEFFQGRKNGVEGLIERINLLKGVSISQIEVKLQENTFLMPGAKELLDFFRSQGIITIVSSGNILPVLTYYQKILNIDYVIGSHTHIENGVIMGIHPKDFPKTDYKLAESQKILEKFSIQPNETVAIGDSRGDISKFLFAGLRIAINPKPGIAEYVDHVIRDDLQKAIPLIQEYNKR